MFNTIDALAGTPEKVDPSVTPDSGNNLDFAAIVAQIDRLTARVDELEQRQTPVNEQPPEPQDGEQDTPQNGEEQKGEDEE